MDNTIKNYIVSHARDCASYHAKIHPKHENGCIWCSDGVYRSIVSDKAWRGTPEADAAWNELKGGE